MRELVVIGAFALLATVVSAGAQPAGHAGVPAKTQHAALDREAASDCQGVSIAKGLKYGEEESNVLDVASVTDSASHPRPVLLFVAGESFSEPVSAGASNALLERAMCLAAQNNLVAVKMAYRLAPRHQWPAAAEDVGAAVAWISENIDLFGGDRNQIIAIGYSVGAFHLASSLAHPKLRVAHSNLAGIVLLSGLYRIGTHSSPSVKTYIGSDPSKYRERSIFPGILFANDPLLIAWSARDSREVVTESEELKTLICEARRGICPRQAMLEAGGSMLSLTELLGEPMQSLIRQIEARGLP